jgi:hypothetical protein
MNYGKGGKKTYRSSSGEELSQEELEKVYKEMEAERSMGIVSLAENHVDNQLVLTKSPLSDVYMSLYRFCQNSNYSMTVDPKKHKATIKSSKKDQQAETEELFMEKEVDLMFKISAVEG